MSAQGASKNAATKETPTKPKTPAETAKPYGTAAKAASSRVAKKDDATPDSAAAAAKDDTVKAIEKLETRTKAVYVPPSRYRSWGSITTQALIDGSNANNIARVANSQLATADEKLSPLMSLKTGKPIEKFPATSKDISKLGCMLRPLSIVLITCET